MTISSQKAITINFEDEGNVEFVKSFRNNNSRKLAKN